MLATRAETVPTGPGWAYEVKWDGIRALLLVRDGVLHITSRLGNDLSDRYPELAGLVAAVAGHDVLLDGEIVAFDAAGRPSFQQLQRRMHVQSPTMIDRFVAEVPVVLMAFELLWRDGEDLTGLAYPERRAALEALGLDDRSWQTPPVAWSDGPAMFAASRELGLEGVVAKRLDSRYESGRRSRAWLKVKHQLRQEMVVGGWVPGEGNRAGTIGALLVGVHDGAGLRYVGRVGTGFDAAMLARLDALLAPLVREASPFLDAGPPPGAVFVEPSLVAEVRFTEWTEEGRIRHPVYLGLRDDRPAPTVTRET
jgi:bifunctional non-homologous end joining protein LigD